MRTGSWELLYPFQNLLKLLVHLELWPRERQIDANLHFVLFFLVRVMGRMTMGGILDLFSRSEGFGAVSDEVDSSELDLRPDSVPAVAQSCEPSFNAA